MLIHPMAERLRGLGLAAMADAFLDLRNQSAADDLSREDWLALLGTQTGSSTDRPTNQRNSRL
jgi:hypothetical protein